jgi:hypothetical protein
MPADIVRFRLLAPAVRSVVDELWKVTALTTLFPSKVTVTAESPTAALEKKTLSVPPLTGTDGVQLPAMFQLPLATFQVQSVARDIPLAAIMAREPARMSGGLKSMGQREEKPWNLGFMVGFLDFFE